MALTALLWGDISECPDKFDFRKASVLKNFLAPFLLDATGTPLGCFGSIGLCRAMQRAVEIPAKLSSIPTYKPTAHLQHQAYRG